MTDATHTGTIDWNRYWAEADEDDREGATPSAHHAAAVVFSYFTLCYVADVEGALENLYDAVAPGGYLVCNYQNRLAQAHWQRMADAPETHLGEESAFDPDRFEARFRLLLDGENLLSYDRIHDALGTWPRSVWSLVEKPDIRWAWRHHPLVFVPK